jgi:hypothetical protein
MKILFLAREGVDLFGTLQDSETSRGILRFYRPERLPYGIKIDVATLGIALSLVSELRWYVRRYMREVLFEVRDRIYCTHLLAREIYEREVTLNENCFPRHLYGIRKGRINRILESSAADNPPEGWEDMEEVLEVWGVEGVSSLPPEGPETTPNDELFN